MFFFMKPLTLDQGLCVSRRSLSFYEPPLIVGPIVRESGRGGGKGSRKRGSCLPALTECFTEVGGAEVEVAHEITMAASAAIGGGTGRHAQHRVGELDLQIEEETPVKKKRVLAAALRVSGYFSSGDREIGHPADFHGHARQTPDHCRVAFHDQRIDAAG